MNPVQDKEEEEKLERITSLFVRHEIPRQVDKQGEESLSTKENENTYHIYVYSWKLPTRSKKREGERTKEQQEDQVGRFQLDTLGKIPMSHYTTVEKCFC